MTKATATVALPKADVRRLLGLSRREAIQFRDQVAGLGIATPDNLKLFVEADDAALSRIVAAIKAKRQPKAPTKVRRLVRAALGNARVKEELAEESAETTPPQLEALLKEAETP